MILVRRELLLADNRGKYIPRVFAKLLPEQLTDWEVEQLSSPDNLDYWQAWERVLGREFTDCTGRKFLLSQDGDLYAEYWLDSETATVAELEQITEYLGPVEHLGYGYCEIGRVGLNAYAVVHLANGGIVGYSEITTYDDLRRGADGALADYISEVVLPYLEEHYDGCTALVCDTYASYLANGDTSNLSAAAISAADKFLVGKSRVRVYDDGRYTHCAVTGSQAACVIVFYDEEEA